MDTNQTPEPYIDDLAENHKALKKKRSKTGIFLEGLLYVFIIVYVSHLLNFWS